MIDGFQRSANTFAVTAFQVAQPEPVNVAHHLHAAAQIIAAVRAGIPTIVLVREPEETILSHMIRLPYATGRQAIKNYIRFCEGVAPYRRGFVVGEFRAVTSDFGAVVRDLNATFHTSFAEFEHTDENVLALLRPDRAAEPRAVRSSSRNTRSHGRPRSARTRRRACANASWTRASRAFGIGADRATRPSSPPRPGSERGDLPAVRNPRAGRKVGWGFADQVVSSATNFALHDHRRALARAERARRRVARLLRLRPVGHLPARADHRAAHRVSATLSLESASRSRAAPSRRA